MVPSRSSRITCSHLRKITRPGPTQRTPAQTRHERDRHLAAPELLIFHFQAVSERKTLQQGQKRPNVAVEWVKLLLRIPKDPNSNCSFLLLNRCQLRNSTATQATLTEVFRDLPQTFQSNARTVSQIKPRTFPSYSFQFIHESS